MADNGILAIQEWLETSQWYCFMNGHDAAHECRRRLIASEPQYASCPVCGQRMNWGPDSGNWCDSKNSECSKANSKRSRAYGKQAWTLVLEFLKG